MDRKKIKYVLKQLGLTNSELVAYLGKLSGFYDTLTPKERMVFRSGMRTFEKEAVKSFHRRVTAQELEEFIRSREPAEAQLVFMLRACADEPDDGKKK